MSHRVRLALEAKTQIRAISDYIAQDSPENARRWRRALHARLRSLTNFPARHEIAYPASTVGRDVRHTFFGVYRVLYAIESDLVVILTVRHGARRPLTPDEVSRLPLK
jgi:plasmid stabilization system protein ParE